LDPSREAEPLGEEAVEAVEVDLGTKIKLRINNENSYDLDYEDGDSETRVPARLIRPLATAAPRDLIPTPLTTTSQAPPPTDVETGGEL